MSNNTRAITQGFIQAWNAGNEAVVDDLASPEIVVSYTHHKEPVRGIEGYKNMLRQAWAHFPDLAIEAEEPMVDGDRAAVAWVYMGTHQRGEIAGVAPAGQRVRVQGITLYRVAEGKVVEERGIVDNMGFMMQLGVSVG